MIGKTISHYRIIEKIGEGGMGVVYRAKDTKLKREVALKVLPEAFARDAERMARFQREAHVLASLNHPHIASIYGLEEGNGVRGLVMELVEGPTLADRITEGPIPLEEGLPLARQMAEALEYAHEKGIVHRDLKPANVKLTEDGQREGGWTVRAGRRAGGRETAPAGSPETSPTLTQGATRAGVILGTAGYMAPEQARGKRIDKRADIWAFGVVLYEMLTAQTALPRGRGYHRNSGFGGQREARPASAAPPKVRRGSSRRCLEKDPKKRLRDIGDMGAMMEEAPPLPVKRSRLPWLVAAVTAIGLFVLAFLHFRETPSEALLRKFTFRPSVGVRMGGVAADTFLGPYPLTADT